MSKSNKVVPKKPRGRPATGRDPVTAIRLSKELRETVDKWASKQADQPGRSEAIRRLVEIGLNSAKISAPSRRLKAAHAERAKELAAKAIDKMSDDLASVVEQADRKRRLTKGPAEFRDARVDQPKKAKGK
jgi:hypothetical protein